MTPAHADTPGFHFFDLKAHDGTVLKANYIAPATPGRHPVVIFINSWGVNDYEYLAQAAKLAGRGYFVLSYCTRGLFFSGGTTDIASPKDVDDVSAAIDWASARPDVDPNEVGTAGISYGAGMSLLAAGHDRRIKATAAMSGWTDLAGSLFQNGTRNLPAPAVLLLFGKLIGREDPELDGILSDFYADRNIGHLIDWANVRSAKTYLAGVNSGNSAIFMGNAFGDSIFPPNQLVDFYNGLTRPRKLEFAPGDHATVEGLGLAGLPNQTWDDVTSWFDHYLAGKGNDTGGPVVLTPHASQTREAYPSWQAVSGHTETYPLSATTIRSGTDTTAGAGLFFVSDAIDGFTGTPPEVAMNSVNRRDGAVWQSAPLAAKQQIRGIAHAKLTITPSAPDGTVVAYLYDVDGHGTGKLITHAPYTYRDATGPRQVDLALNAAAYDVPAGHHVALVIDTKDSRYIDEDRAGSTVALTGSLDLPLR